MEHLKTSLTDSVFSSLVFKASASPNAIKKMTNKPYSKRRKCLALGLRRNLCAAFTLIELLVVLTVMVTLGGMLTYALASATTSARNKRTQADLLSIGQLMQTRLNEIALSQVNLQFGTPDPSPTIAAASGPGTVSLASATARRRFESQERARLVLLARRDLMRMVLPECRADLLYPPASLQFRTRASATANLWRANVAQVQPPSQWNQMRSQAHLLTAIEIDAAYSGQFAHQPEDDAILEAGVPLFEALLKHDARFTWDPSAPNAHPNPWTRLHESSECLYLILATTELFGKRAIDNIPTSQIADTDNDGIPEILDAWGQPYEFIRNPVGMRHPSLKNFNPSGATSDLQYPLDPDPLDFLTADFRFDATTHPTPTAAPATAFYPTYLPPVIVSSGPDREFGMIRVSADTDEDGVVDSGVSESYSASVVRMPTGTGSVGPLDSRVSVFRYPDPFFQFSAVSFGSTANHEFSVDGTRLAKEGDGLGGIVDSELYADNITSLDADF